MDVFYPGFMAGLMRGLNQLPADESSAVLAECGKACATPAILPAFRVLLEKADNTDDFFASIAGVFEGSKVIIVTPDKAYDFCYPSCLCPLHEECGINDARLCECSRQSLLFLMRELFPQRTPQVELMETVLKGDPQCRLRVRLST